MRAWVLTMALVACGPFNDTRWCESNPEDCASAPIEETGTEPTSPAGLCGGPPEAAAACEVMIEHCYECHGESGRAEGGFNYARDVLRMVQTGKVVPFDPPSSRVHSRMASQTMPPADVAKRPTDADLRTVRSWIEEGAPDWSAGDDCAARDFVSPSSEMELVVDDLLDLPNATDQRNTRYLSLTHLWNSCVSGDELETYRYGLSKLVNSLSYGSDPVLPRAIDEDRLVFAIDLRDLVWDERNGNGVDAWEHMVKRIPYGLSRLGSANARDLTRSRLPVLPADWVVFSAARPPLYDEVLRLPDTGDGFLLERFQVDRIDDILTSDVLRAGFEGSGVSDNNRMVERHDGFNGPGSYCWVSYDFDSDVGARNILSHPLHPSDPVGECPEAANHTFVHVGGELICSLPNGMQAYYLEEGDGTALDVGPIEIVQDFTGPEAPVVMNGVSCMFCHAQGIIEKADDVSKHWDNNRLDFPSLFPECVNDTVELSYRPDAVLQAMTADRERFLAAMEAVGVPREQVTEPVAVLSDAFSEDMTALRVAAELGLDHRDDEDGSPSRFRQCIEQLETNDPEVALELSPLLSDLTISREIFLRVASEVACGCDFIDRDDFQCRTPAVPEDACGPAGIACLDGQVCVTVDADPTDRTDDRGACVEP